MTHGFVVTVVEAGGVKPFSMTESTIQPKIHYDDTYYWLKQPVSESYVQCYSDDNYFLVTIGKAYDSPDLASTLANYMASGDDVSGFVSTNLGQYCALIYERRKQAYTLISDASGVRSLFYTVVNNQLFVASSIGMMREVLGDVICQRNMAAESFMLRYAFLPPGQTVYDSVYELPPGQCAKMSNNSSTPEHVTPLTTKTIAYENSGDYSSDLSSLLMSVCKQQAGDAKRIAVLLGGFDSALVASMLVRLGYQVETFSFRYASEEYNQPHVESLAQYLSIKHHWVDIDHHVILQGIKNYSDSCNTPTIWPNYVIQTQYVCRLMAEQGFDACFSGDGCDTAFMGYPSTYRRGGVYQLMPKLPVGLSSALISLLDKTRLELAMGHIYRVGLSLLRASSYQLIQRPLRSFQLFDPHSYRRLTGKDGDFNTDAIFSELELKTKDFSFDRKMYFGKSLFSPNRAKLVGSSDTAGFVVDSPYMHPSVKAFAQSLPDEVLRPQDSDVKEGKELLMKMAEREGLLPTEIIYQKKLAAIKSPIDDWYSKELMRFSREQCDNLPFSVDRRYLDSLINDLFLERFYKNYFSDDRVVSLAISMLVTYAAYFK